MHLLYVLEQYFNSFKDAFTLIRLKYFDSVVFILLFISTLFINKYVLSVLKFTFPTVFQGWQTLVGMIILKVLLSQKKIAVTTIDKASAINLLPHCIFFVGSIVAGSKALSTLPIPVFVSVSNLPPVFIFLLDYSASVLVTNLVQLTAGILSLGAAVSILILDARLPFADSGYSWLLAHVIFTTAQLLYSRLTNPRFTETDKLYYNNIFGVVILAPSSFYLEEAFSALNFQHRHQIRFYLGCLLSGVLGAALQLWASQLQSNQLFSHVSALAKIAACVLASLMFTSDLSIIIWAFVVLNLVSTLLIPCEIVELTSSSDSAECFEV